MKHFSREQLESGLAEIRQSPKDKGVLNLTEPHCAQTGCRSTRGTARGHA